MKINKILSTLRNKINTMIINYKIIYRMKKILKLVKMISKIKFIYRNKIINIQISTIIKKAYLLEPFKAY